jgi:hypothetical protein
MMLATRWIVSDLASEAEKTLRREPCWRTMRPGMRRRPACHDTRHGGEMRNVVLWQTSLVASVMAIHHHGPLSARNGNAAATRGTACVAFAACVHRRSTVLRGPVAIRFGPPSGAGKAMGCKGFFWSPCIARRMAFVWGSHTLQQSARSQYTSAQLQQRGESAQGRAAPRARGRGLPFVGGPCSRRRGD